MYDSSRFLFLPVFLLVFLTACASMPSDFEEPKVTITSFTPVNSGSIGPEFDIVLRVTNPNRTALELEGMSYTIDIDGNEVMSGVANDLPTIKAYGEADVKLKATANLFGGFKLLTGMMNEYKDKMEYEFNAKLDVGSFVPRIKVSKKGTFSFTQSR